MNFAQITPFYSPSAWLDLNAIDANIDIVNKKVKSKRLRIASKSVRSIDALKYIANHSPNFIGIMSYDAQESQFLIENGFNDVLCAYPQMNTQTIKACEQLVIEQLTYGRPIKMTWMVDSLEHWNILEEIGRSLNTKIRVCFDINMSTKFPAVYFGTKRSSINTAKQLELLIKSHRKLRHKSQSYTQIVGLMGYEAQIAGLAETAKGKESLAPIIRLFKDHSKKQVSKLRKACVKSLQKVLQEKALQNEGGKLEIINGGGSGSMNWSCTQDELTEVTIGSAYYMPAYFSYMDSMHALQPAAGFVLPVTRKPNKNTVTCHSGGFIASGAMGKDKLPVIHYPQGLNYLTDEGFGEVQTPLKLSNKKPSNQQLQISMNVWFRHAKAGELCEHFNQLHVFRDGIQIDTFTTYRGQGKCFH